MAGSAVAGQPSNIFATATMRVSVTRRAPPTRRSTAVAAAALLEGPDRAQKVDLAKGRPQDVGKIELAVGALPQQEPGETDLPARADDQVRIRQTGSVEMAGDGFGSNAFDRLRQCRLLGHLAVEQGANGVGNLLTTAIRDSDVELEAVIFGSGALGRCNRREHRLREHRQAADCPDAHAPAMDRGVAC